MFTVGEVISGEVLDTLDGWDSYTNMQCHPPKQSLMLFIVKEVALVVHITCCVCMCVFMVLCQGKFQVHYHI